MNKLILVVLMLAFINTSCSTWTEAFGVGSTPTYPSIPTLPPNLSPRPVLTYTNTPEITLSPSGSPASTTTPQLFRTMVPSSTITATQSPSLCVPRDAHTDYGIVKWVTEGDTIVVDVRGRLYTVRYLGIDSPSDSAPVEFMGQAAAQRNAELVLDRVVRLVSGNADTDKFGQLLRFVFVDDLFINYELLRQGLARASDGQSGGECANAFAQAELAARREALGIWAPVAMLLPTTRQPEGGTLVPGTPTPIFQPPGTTALLPPTQTTSQQTPTQSINTLPPLPTFTLPPPGSTLIPTLTPTLTPTPTRSPVVSPTQIPYVDIIWIFFEGEEPGQADEFVELENFDSIPINLAGWILDSEETEKTFVFPNFVLQPEEYCRVYTNKIEIDSCGGSFQSSQEVWSDISDCAYLYTPQGIDVTFYCY